MLGLKKRHQCSDQRFCRIRAPCVVSTAAETEEKEEQMTRSLKREKSAGPRTDPCGTPRRTQKQ